jgi:hypothetical protein
MLTVASTSVHEGKPMPPFDDRDAAATPASTPNATGRAVRTFFRVMGEVAARYTASSTKAQISFHPLLRWWWSITGSADCST